MEKPSVIGWLVVAVAALGVSASAAPIQGPDTTTQGNWVGVYGSQGYVLPAYARATGGAVNPGSNADDLASLPAAIDDYTVGFYTTSGAGRGRGLWSASTTDVRALQDPANPSGARKANYWFDSSGFDVTMKLNQPARYNMSVYTMSWDSAARNERIVVPGKTSVDTGDIYDGNWYTTDVSGDEFSPIRFSIEKLGGTNAVIQAITFDTATDDATQGSWVGTYGADGYILPGFGGTAFPGTNANDVFDLPEYVDDYSLIPAGRSGRFQWASSTADPRGVQDPTGTSRKANCYFCDDGFTLHLDANIPTYFDLSLYLLDWDTGGQRAGSIEIPSMGVDDAVAGYNNGRWYLYRVYAGPDDPLDVTFTQSSGNAVVSAICFDNAYTFPEPATLTLVGGGLLLAAWRRRRRR